MMDKESYYNIEVEYNNGVILYNSLSNSIVYFTNEEFSVVKPLMENLKEFSIKYPLLYENLKKSGFVIEDEFNELEYIKLQNKRKIFVDNDYHLTINPTLDCNLHCWYCSTEYAKATHQGRMSKETINSVKAHIKNIIEVQKAASFHLDWFGGEPLIYFDEVIEPISRYANELTSKNNVKFSQHITTNATLMDEKRILKMKELNFTSFQIPIDGNEHRHNKIKRNDDGEGTYKVVMDHVNTIIEKIPNIFIMLRINYDRQTLKNIKDIVKDISESSKKNIQIDFQKVWQINCTDKDIELLKETKNFFLENGLNSQYWAYNPKAFHRCYADKIHQYAINYDGKVYKCTAQNYGDDKVIGTLQKDGEIKWNDQLLSKLFSHSTFENERCLKCKNLPICMGPCIIRNFEARTQNKPLPCVSESALYSLSSYIIEDAKRRNII